MLPTNLFYIGFVHGVVVKDTAIGAEGLEFDYRAGQIWYERNCRKDLKQEEKCRKMNFNHDLKWATTGTTNFMKYEFQF